MDGTRSRQVPRTTGPVTQHTGNAPPRFLNLGEFTKVVGVGTKSHMTDRSAHRQRSPRTSWRILKRLGDPNISERILVLSQMLVPKRNEKDSETASESLNRIISDFERINTDLKTTVEDYRQVLIKQNVFPVYCHTIKV